MIKFVLIFFSVLCFSYAYPAFSCEESFIKVEELSIGDFRNLSPNEIAKIPVKEIQKLNSEQLRILNFEQLLSLPLQHLLLTQLSSISDLNINRIVSKNTQFQEDHPSAFSLLIRLRMRDISPYSMAFVSTGEIRKWSEHDIKKLTPDQVQVFNAEQIIAFGKMVVYFSSEQIQAFGENIRHFLPEQLALFSHGQTSKLELSQLAVLSEGQLQAVGYINFFLR